MSPEFVRSHISSKGHLIYIGLFARSPRVETHMRAHYHGFPPPTPTLPLASLH